MLSSIFLVAISIVHGASAAIIPRAPIKIVQGNDDGWAVANIRRLFDVLNATGFSVRPLHLFIQHIHFTRALFMIVDNHLRAGGK